MAAEPKTPKNDCGPEKDKADQLTAQMDKRDPVDEASEESFPASDPPSWTPTHLLDREP